MNDNLVGLREDIVALKQSKPDSPMLAAIQIQTQLEEIQSNIDTFRDRLSDVSEVRGAVVDHVIEKVAYELKTGVRDLNECKPLTPPQPLG